MAEARSQITPEMNTPHLSKSPIIEAAIEIHASASISGEPFTEMVKKTFPGYALWPATFTGSTPSPTTRAMLKSGPENKRMLRISPDGLLVSEVGRYPGWSAFSTQALEIWNEFCRSFGVSDPIHRASLRFINHIEMPVKYRLEDFLLSPPKPPVGLDLTNKSMMGEEIFAPLDMPYVIRILRTIQQSSPRANGLPALILDLEIDTINPIGSGELSGQLEKMRELINRVFFGIVTKAVVEKCR